VAALLLVDPPLLDTKPMIYVERHDQNGVELALQGMKITSNNAFIERPPRLSDLSYPAHTKKRFPRGISMYDDLLLIQHGYLHEKPSDAANGSRRLVLAREANTFQAAFSAAYSLALASTAGIPVTEEMSSLDFANLERRAWRSEWEGRRFTKLWEQRENLELLRYRLRQNIQTIESLTSKDQNPKNPKGDRDPDRNDPRVQEMERKILADYKQQQNDLQEWKNLDKTADYINELVVRTTESYLQTVAARESQASNFQATRCVSPF
jgi:hypothetical protein